MATNYNNPLFRKPMEHGYRREIVDRTTKGKNTADVYYWSPTKLGEKSKKMRSMREVDEHLALDLAKNELEKKNFIFCQYEVSDHHLETHRKASPRSVNKRKVLPQHQNAVAAAAGKNEQRSSGEGGSATRKDRNASNLLTAAPIGEVLISSSSRTRMAYEDNLQSSGACSMENAGTRKDITNSKVTNSVKVSDPVEYESQPERIYKRSLAQLHDELSNSLAPSNTSSSATKRVFSLPEPQFPPPPPPPVAEDEDISLLMSPVSNCEALFDFVANDCDELSFKAGDIIGLVDKPSDDWWLGTLNGDKGLFPVTYVKVLSQDENFSQLSQASTSKTDGCFVKALYTFEAQQDGDLAFQEGDDIEVLYRINQNWLYGKSNGKEGQFPDNFVQKSEENDQENQNYLSIRVAKYQFIAENADELSFEEGDRIVIVEKLSSDWWKGYLYSDKSQKNGIFPSTFVHV